MSSEKKEYFLFKCMSPSQSTRFILSLKDENGEDTWEYIKERLTEKYGRQLGPNGELIESGVYLFIQPETGLYRKIRLSEPTCEEI